MQGGQGGVGLGLQGLRWQLTRCCCLFNQAVPLPETSYFNLIPEERQNEVENYLVTSRDWAAEEEARVLLWPRLGGWVEEEGSGAGMELSLT